MFLTPPPLKTKFFREAGFFEKKKSKNTGLRKKRLKQTRPKIASWDPFGAQNEVVFSIPAFLWVESINEKKYPIRPQQRLRYSVASKKTENKNRKIWVQQKNV